MLDRVLKFFITSFLAIAGGALFHLLAPILTDFLSTEVLQTDLGIFKLTQHRWPWQPEPVAVEAVEAVEAPAPAEEPAPVAEEAAPAEEVASAETPAT